jgi:hypothetical protein
MGQTDEKNDTVLQGRTGPVIFTVFPLATDIHLKNSKHSIVYPLLVVNNVLIRDEKMVNCFRNHFDRTKIKKIKSISKEEAEKKGISNVPKDGVLFVTMKKGYYFDFACQVDL